MASDKQHGVATLGLFILDTFEWRAAPEDGEAPRTTRQEQMIGGGGTYASLGARMWLQASEVGMIVDRGHDWSASVQDELSCYGADMFVFRNHEGETCRAVNRYTGEHRDFDYLTERIRIEPIDLVPTRLVRSNWLHFVCSPTRALVIYEQLTNDDRTPQEWRPKLCWEPIPALCVPEEFESLRQMLPHLAVFSPNHEEAWGLFGVSPEESNARGKAGIEEVAQKFVAEGATGNVVIRCGALGAYVLDTRGQGSWVPAYHTDPSRVVDPTGAGNSFLGGLMAGLEQDEDDLTRAVSMASVSASFIIEQFGLPTLSTSPEGDELWNGVKPSDRLHELLAREKRDS